MTPPTDGNAASEPPDHPDLVGVAGGMRAEWRAEQQSAAADAAAQWRHGRGIADWLADRMHAGDRIAVAAGVRTFVGVVEEAGSDLVALRGTSGRVEINLGAGVPLSFEVVEHATAGGTRGARRRGFRDALLARDAQPGIRVGTRRDPDGVDATLLVGRDCVTIVAAGGTETLVPIAEVVWVAPAPG